MIMISVANLCRKATARSFDSHITVQAEFMATTMTRQEKEAHELCQKNVTDRSSSCNIIFLSLTPCDVFQRGLFTSAAYAPINHAVLILNSTLFRHLHRYIINTPLHITFHKQHVYFRMKQVRWSTLPSGRNVHWLTCGCVACCPLVSHTEYALHALLRLENRQTDGCQTVTLHLPLDVASITRWITSAW